MADRRLRGPSPRAATRPASRGAPGPAAERRFARRLLLLSVAAVVAFAGVLALVTGVATGRWGDLGMPTDAEGRPRGLLVVGGATLLAAAAAAMAYRRARGPVGDLLEAAARLAAGEPGPVDVQVRGPRELRLLTATFNDMAGRLAADEEQRRQFLADITHELRNPIAVLQSEIEAQLDGVRPRDDDQLGSLLDETRRLGHLVDDLHTLALAERGRLTLRQGELDLGRLAEEAVARHGAHARRRGVVLRASVGPDVGAVPGDPARVRQVLDNLLTNALRHAPAGSAVEVAVAPVLPEEGGEGPLVQCRVVDAGPGFGADQLDRVFDRFTRSADSRGSGLGLSIARDLVHAHGGTIEAANDPTSGGAAVRFTLPARRVAHEAREAAARP